MGGWHRAIGVEDFIEAIRNFSAQDCVNNYLKANGIKLERDVRRAREVRRSKVRFEDVLLLLNVDGM